MLIDIKNLNFIKNITGIIHIGAHECEERINYLLKFHNITDDDIIWIDALSEKVDTIKKNYPTIKIYNECISEQDNESIIFNVTNNYQSSSFLKLKEHLIEHPDIHKIKEIEMKTKTLKTFYRENNFSYDRFNFMVLDIQGAELLALKGANEILDYIDFIYLEVNTKELYENCALIGDIDNYLNNFNFKRKDTLMTEHGWGDAFYVKNIYKLSSNYKIKYGIEEKSIDITNVILKSVMNNVNSSGVFHIPCDDNNRASLFGDPLYGIIKNIYIEDEINNFIIDVNTYVNLDTTNNLIYINRYNNSKKKLSVMAIFKNETMNLKLWLEHYIWQGVEHFYLIDNDSNDVPLSILQWYIDNEIVSYYFKPEKYKQAEHYRNIFDCENLKEKTEWLCICDLDEFLFGTERKLCDVLDEFNEYDVINTHSFFYGSDNFIKHPDDIRLDIVHRTNDIVNGNKYIFKPRVINDSSEIWIHWLVDSGTLNKRTNIKEIFTDTKIRLNHYITQSLEFWKNVKMTRGDSNVPENDCMRDINMFNEYERNSNIKDDILKSIIENNIYDKNGEEMKFYDENGVLINNKSIEYVEQGLAKQFISKNDVVLELGARYGSVSCTINKNLLNKKNQISVEPDDRVWDSLYLNKVKNNCNFNIVKGFISKKKLDLTNIGFGLSGYGSTFIENDNTKIQSFSLDEIKYKNNINKFTALVADCEGFLETFFDENPELYSELRLVIFEMDYTDKCNYDKIKDNLIKHGFINELNVGPQNVWIKN